MSVVALASAKGSPGVTTTALVFAAAWPSGRQQVVVELDPAGGDIGAWFGIGSEPGLGSLAARARRGDGAGSRLLDHSQPLPGGVPVLVAPPGAAQARRAVGMVAEASEQFGQPGELDVLLDCGRIDPESPAAAALARADRVILVSRAGVAALGHLAGAVEAVGAACASLGVILVGKGPYPAAEIAEAVGAEVLGVLADDPDSAAGVASGRLGTRAERRSPLFRSASDLVGSLAGPDAAAEAPAPSSHIAVDARSYGAGRVVAR